jgi:hypothetical protein
MGYAAFGCRALLAAVFAVAVASKLRGAAAFVDATHRLLPARWADLARPLAAGTAGTELAVLALLVPPATVRWGCALAAAVLAAFTVAVWSALRRGERAPCRCLGATTAPLSRRHLARNGLLGAAALTGALVPAGGATPAGSVLAVAVGLVVAVLVVRLDDLVELFLPHPSLRS